MSSVFYKSLVCYSPYLIIDVSVYFYLPVLITSAEQLLHRATHKHNFVWRISCLLFSVHGNGCLVNPDCFESTSWCDTVRLNIAQPSWTPRKTVAGQMLCIMTHHSWEDLHFRGDRSWTNSQCLAHFPLGHYHLRIINPLGLEVNSEGCSCVCLNV